MDPTTLDYPSSRGGSTRSFIGLVHRLPSVLARKARCMSHALSRFLAFSARKARICFRRIALDCKDS